MLLEKQEYCKSVDTVILKKNSLTLNVHNCLNMILPNVNSKNKSFHEF